MTTIMDALNESLRSGLLFGVHDEPLDAYGKRIVRVIVDAMERSSPSHVATTASDAFNAAINFALDTCDSGDCRSFLDMWREGDWEGIALHFADFKGPLPCTPERLPAAPVVDDDQRSAKPLPADSSAASSPSATEPSEKMLQAALDADIGTLDTPLKELYRLIYVAMEAARLSDGEAKGKA